MANPTPPRAPTQPAVTLPDGQTCLHITFPIPGPLPTGFGISPPTPPTIPGIGLCCKAQLPIPPIPWPPIPGILVNSALIAAINTAMKTVREYIAALPLGKCPRVSGVNTST